MNRWMAIGRLCKDVDLRHGRGGAPYLQNSLAIDNYYEGQKSTVFVNIAAFGKTAEVISQYASKGKRIGVEGRLVTNEWTDKQGVTRRDIQCVIDRVDVIDFPAQDTAGLSPYEAAKMERRQAATITGAYAPPKPQAPLPRQASPMPPVDIDREDIPF